MTGLHITCDGKSAVISWFENGWFHYKRYEDQYEAIREFDRLRVSPYES